MKLHPRYNVVARARNQMSELALRLQGESDITIVEMLGVLLTLAADQQRFLLRDERHGNTSTKADEEHPAMEILRAIIDASDGCQGHRECEHSMEPWQRARALLRSHEEEM